MGNLNENALAKEKKCSIRKASGTYQPPGMVGIDDGAAEDLGNF
jgi:hypothetical protein